GGAEELLDDGGDGPDVDEALGGDGVQVLDGHALPDDPLQPGEAHAELVLQQLAHAAQAAVAQVVDVVGGTGAVDHAVEVVDGGAGELLDDGGDGPDVDEALGGDGVQVLDGHALPDDPLQPGEAHAELVLQQLAHAAQAAVAQVVDVVGGTGAVDHAVEVVDG